MQSRRNKIIGIVLLAAYIFLRMFADPVFWRNISEYYSYAFEIVFVTSVYFFFQKEIQLFKRPNRSDALICVAMIASGYLVYLAAGWAGITIPFDLSSNRTLFLLLILAPILEELIFRMALWESVQALFNNAWITVCVTTFLFSAGHFAAYWFVPEQFQSFIVYQTLYVVFLGSAAGLRKKYAVALSSSIIVHFGFNFGFFLGYLYMRNGPR